MAVAAKSWILVDLVMNLLPVWFRNLWSVRDGTAFEQVNPARSLFGSRTLAGWRRFRRCTFRLQA
jgi:hypothetical protein